MIHFTSTAIEIFGFSVRYYGILIALGVLAGIVAAEKREKRLGLEKDTVIDLALWVLPGALIGARLYYVLFSFDQYRDNLLSILDIRAGGMAIYGGIIAGVLIGFLYARKKRVSFLSLADIAAPSVAIGQAIGRWGNFINQEAFGIEITLPHLQFFPVSVYIDSAGGYYAATFFYESAWCLLIFICILLLEKRGRFQKAGDCALFYGTMYAFERALVEGLRTDSLYIGPVRASQALSILLIAAAALILVFRIPSHKKRRLTAIIPSSAAAIALFRALIPGTIGVYAFCVSMIVLLSFVLRLLFSACPSKAANAREISEQD